VHSSQINSKTLKSENKHTLQKNKMAAIFYIYFKYFIDKSIELDNRLCLMHNPRKIVKVSPVLFTSVSQTIDDFCRQKCFNSSCLAKNKQVMATQSKLVALTHFVTGLVNLL
jgi:hypothetical protein